MGDIFPVLVAATDSPLSLKVVYERPKPNSY